MDIPTMKSMENKTDYIATGVYEACLTAIQDGGTKTFKGRDNPDRTVSRVVLMFSLIGQGQEYNIPFFGFAPATSANKLGRALIALGYRGKFDGNVIDENTLIGSVAKVFVKEYMGTDQDGKPCVKCSISEVMPITNKAKCEDVK